MRQFGRILTLILVATLSSPTYAQGEDGQSEPGKGTAPLVSGIILTSAGTSIGLLAILFGMEGMGHDCPQGEATDKCNPGTGIFLGGVALVGVGLGAGIPLIVHGARQRRRWREWNGEQQAGPAASYRIDLVPTMRGASVLLTCTLP